MRRQQFTRFFYIHLHSKFSTKNMQQSSLVQIYRGQSKAPREVPRLELHLMTLPAVSLPVCSPHASFLLLGKNAVVYYSRDARQMMLRFHYRAPRKRTRVARKFVDKSQKNILCRAGRTRSEIHSLILGLFVIGNTVLDVFDEEDGGSLSLEIHDVLCLAAVFLQPH